MPDHQPKQDSKAYNHFLPFLNSAWKVLIDTSAFMNDGAQQFFTVNVPLLLEKKLYLITPLSCVRELERHASAQGPRPNESMEQFRCRQIKGKRGLAIVKTLLGMKVLEVRGEAGDDRVADGVFHRVVIQHRRHYNLLLITNDRDLATDIFEMNEMRSLASKKEIAVRRIKEDGNLGVLTAKNNPTKPLLADRGKQPARAQRYRQAKDAHSAPHETQANAPVRREALNRPAATAAVTNSDLSGQTSSNTKADNRLKPFARQTPPPRVQQTAASANTPKPRSDRFNRASHGPASGKPLRPNFYRFPLASVVTSIPDDPVPVSEVPTTTAILHDEAGRVCQLLARLGSGGEGAVYETNTPYVAKIYHRGKVTRRKIEKIRRLTEHPIDYPGICSPQTMLFNDREEFVGFLMKRAAGHDLNRCLMVRPLLEQRFAGWKKADLVRLCITILEKISYLHERNIILGDINLSNVRVVSPTEVYLVDCDSYQVGDIPCPVGMVNFTPPEIRGDYNAILRTKGNEYFAVATMIFMILVPGKTPYAHKEGGQGSENIAEGLFPYPYEDKSTGKVPYGLWGFIWSHMSYEVKRAFGNTFDKNGLFYEEKKRLTVDNWLDILGNYLRLLTNGTMATQDPMSVEIYPTRFKRHPESSIVRCRLCGQEFDEKSGKDGICNSCLFTRGDILTCERCGADFAFSNYDRFVLKRKEPRHCPKCHAELSKDVPLALPCSVCGREFSMKRGEYEWYLKQNLSLPKRCKACRSQEKERAARVPAAAVNPEREFWVDNRGAAPAYGARPNPSTPPSPPQKKRGCFITTAVCECLGKPDDCCELVTLRQYRDDWLAKQPDGPALIDTYYDIAPGIVAKLKASPLFEQHCAMIRERYLIPCIADIEAGRNEACLDRYRTMCRTLEEMFA